MLIARLDSTPLGVFDGVFTGIRSRQGHGTNLYHVRNVSAKKTRDIRITFDAEKPTGIDVSPPFTSKKYVPPGLVQPVTTDMIDAFGKVARHTDCLERLRIFDGRRVILLENTDSELLGETRTCMMSYSVIDGPGHVPPFNFRNMKVKLVYARQAPTGDQLRSISIRVGLYTLQLQRIR
ncbi:hypothetical protein [Shimia abyssi]|uniref:Uncharacterized protein n=1 Tax=Shimia abyssi TaxID=1662395 RepID=A0A2P8FFP1_9RHOB|nr:hypothetical protein [Shimia abyssi]PSL20532.1 hypothetical protein CLV88_103179 [Shimia abyssi]